jgi:hypothetical protein
MSHLLKITMQKLLFSLLIIAAAGTAFAKSGGVDNNNCHTTSEYVRECFGKNKGKYIPVSEAKRIENLHISVCSGLDGDGRKPKFDYYGKRCRNSHKKSN